MLRKDVKLGFAIGGIMLAVVVVYVLVVPSGDKKNVGIVTDDSPSTKTDATPTPGTPDATLSDAKPVEPLIADKTNAPPADPTKLDTGAAPATMPSGTSSAAASGTTSSGPDWNKLLAEGSSSPTLMSETPTVAPKGSDALAATTPPDAAASTTPTPLADQAPAAPAVGDNAASAEKATPDLAIDTTATPATQPADSGERTHIVQSGETLTSISQASFGTSRKWKLIAAANPNINPNRLPTGTKLVIPAAATVDASSATLASSKIDSSTQYVVQPSDSLYRISMKLYGKPDHVDKLYQDNKDVIGSDPRRLKLNEVLKLTDAPTTNAGSH